MGLTSLSSKYRTAWLNSTEIQRMSICNRLGIGYTFKEDDELLTKVADRQQGEYDQIRLASSSTPERHEKSK